MKGLRKRNIVRTIFFFSTLLLGLAAVAPAQVQRPCSNAGVAGEWGHAFTGTLILPTGPVPIAAIGRVTIDAEGSISGTQTSSRNGAISEDTIKATVTVNSDCTGTLNVSIYDQSGTTLRRTATWDVVFVDNEREFRAVMTSLVPAGGTSSLPVTITMDAKKQFHGVLR